MELEGKGRKNGINERAPKKKKRKENLGQKKEGQLGTTVLH